MTTPRTEKDEDRVAGPEEDPQNLPPKTWVTLALFAAFAVAFGTCMSTFMFN